MLGFSAAFVWDFYFILTFVLTLMECIKLMSVREIEYKKNKNLSITGLLLTLFLVFFLGLRPEDGKIFVDMRMYAWSYNNNFTSSDPFFNFLSHFVPPLISDSEYSHEYTGSNCRSDYSGYIRAHGMHEQEVCRISFCADFL